MASFNRNDYLALFAFAREQYFWHESTGRSFDLKAAIVMQKCEDCIGQQSGFPEEARRRLAETPQSVQDKVWRALSDES